jgi:signal transduction histidine kinase
VAPCESNRNERDRQYDTGSGIEPQHLPHVFERFYRADPARTAGSGAGLGLSIAKTIVEAHHAQIEIQSHAGRGTRVVVSIPVIGQTDPVTVGRESAANG